MAAVHSVLMLGIAAAVFHFFGANFAVPPESPPLTASASNCPGKKLNYPQTVQTLFRGKKISFKYNCIWSGFSATSYDKNCEGCNETTATGTILTHGTCAVDPKVIPLGTYFYVPNYGLCHAEDTGGAVKVKKIDLGFDDVRNGWWSQRYNPTDIYTFVK